MKNILFFTFLNLFFFSTSANGQSLKMAQDYLDHSNYSKAIPLFVKISKEAKRKNDIFVFISSQNGLADCYTDVGAYYKSIKVLKGNLVLLNKHKSKEFHLYATTHLLLAQNFDYLFLLDNYLKHCKLYYYYINKKYPKKEIYKALYYSYMGRYYNLTNVEQANYYTSNALKIYHKNKKDASLIDVYKLYSSHTFTIRNDNTPLILKYKYVDSLNLSLNNRYPYDNLKKSRLLITSTANNLDGAIEFLNTNPKLGKYYLNKAVIDYKKGQKINEKLIGFNYIQSTRFNELKGFLYNYDKEYI